MAEVFLAASLGPEGFEKAVVLKRVRSSLSEDPSFVKMFIAEARVASKLNHANVVHIFDFDRYGDSYYLAMEYVRGKSLSDAQRRARLRRIAPAPVLCAHLVMEVARGLGYAHRLTDHGRPLNLVHRDVTPQNVLLSFDGGVKLADFGIAKASDNASTAGMLKGKFAYMAPEQSRGETVDARTDVFALGIVLWELLTQVRLFEGDSDLAVLRAVQERPIPSPTQFNPGVDEALASTVLKALERDPRARFQTAQEFERALLPSVLRGTHSAEDTDVGGFLRRIFPGEMEADEQLVAPLRPVTASGSASPGRAEGQPGMHSTVTLGPHRVDPTALSPTEQRPSKRPSVEGQEATASLVTDPRQKRKGQKHPVLNLLTIGVASALLTAGAGVLLVRAQSGPRAASATAFERSTTSAPVVTADVAPAPSSRPAGNEEAPTTRPPILTSPPVGPAVVPPVAPRPPEPTRESVARPAKRASPGFLRLEVRPWGALSIDSKGYGDVEGASSLIPLSPGEHTIRVQVPGKETKSWRVSIESGKTTSLKHHFVD